MRVLYSRCGRGSRLLTALAAACLTAILLTMSSERISRSLNASSPLPPHPAALSPALRRCLGEGARRITPAMLDAACAQAPPEPCHIARLDHLDLAGFAEARLRLPSSGAAVKIFIYPPGDLISDSVRRRGSWEADRVRFLNMALRAWPRSVLIDAGSSIGVYSLSAARVGRRVLAIDANYRNALRLAKSAVSNGLSDLIKVYWNAVSSQPSGTGLRLRLPADCNVGGAVPVDDAGAVDGVDEVQPRAAGLDQLIASSGSHLAGEKRGVFLKLDIEGQEWNALKTGQRLFSSRNVPLVMTEWGSTAANRPDLAVRIMQFLGDRDYRPYELLSGRDQGGVGALAPLSLEHWRTWPGDIMWTRNVTLLTDGWRV